jgi:DNA gyrase subunit A
LNEEDAIEHLTSASTHDNILFFTDRGRVFQTKVYEIPPGSRTAKGKSIHNFLEIPPNEKISALVAYSSGELQEEKNFLVMATAKGLVKRTALSDFGNVRRTGIIAIKLKADDTLRWVEISEGNDEIILVTAGAQAIRFKEKDLRPLGRSASGVAAIRLKKNDVVAGLGIIRGKEMKERELLVVSEKGFAKRTPLKEYKVQRRGGSGIKTGKVTEKTGALISATILEPESAELVAFSSKGQALRTEIKNIRVASRATQGVRIMNLKAGDKLMGIVCL